MSECSCTGAEEKIRLRLKPLPVLAVGETISNGSNGFRSMCIVVEGGPENVRKVREVLFGDKNLNVYGFGYPIMVPKKIGDMVVMDADYENVWEVSFHI